MGHCYQWGAPGKDRIDYRLGNIEFSAFDMIWLGGDLCSRTSEEIATLHYLDSLLYISQPTTHWAIGNHDIVEGPLSRIEAATGRPSFYSSWANGLVVMVLNTTFNHPQLEARGQCAQMDAQMAMIRAVTDTIRAASHLVLLHHHALLTNELAGGELDMDTLWHYYRPRLPMSCQPSGSFQELIYPLLEKVHKRGVQVVLVGGDVGQRCKSFEFRTKEGIWFLGSGINNSMGRKYIPPWVTNLEPDQILIFEHDLKKKELTWRFELLGKTGG